MVAVVSDHLAGEPSGGFVGVDVFFVISGFLITGLLIREHRLTGGIRLLGFYRRRIKRTLPVAWAVLVVTLLVGSAVLSSYAFAQLLPASFAAGSFWSNWQLIAVGTDYLHAADAAVAVQHYWSLAVEEQFYLVWPAVLIMALALSSRTRRLRRLPEVLLGAAVLASLGWAAVETTMHPTSAYFSTLTRAWELLAGASLAFAAPLLSCLPLRLRPWLAWSGLALLIATLVVLSPDSSFPYPWAIAAVLGTVLVIAAGTGTDSARVWPLTNPVAQYIGTISYSVYLWHFPVIAFSNVFHPIAGSIVQILEVLLTLTLSVLSYHLIETPLRRASWRRFHLPHIRMRQVVRAIGGVIVVVLLCGVIVVSKHPAPVQSIATTGYFPTTPTRLQSTRSHDIDEALSDVAWPVLTPSEDELGANARADEWLRDGCLVGFGVPMTARRCVFGDSGGPRTVVIYGDSVALSYTPAVREALAGRGWRIETMTRVQCPAIAISVTKNDGEPNTACDAYHRRAMQQIERLHPALVLMASSHLSLNRLTSGAKGTAAMSEWAERTRTTVARLASVAGHVIVLDAPPVGVPTQTCKTPSSTPQDCVSSVRVDWKQAARSQRSGVRQVAAANVAYPSTLPWFCNQHGQCPPFVEGTVILADGEHLTEESSQQLGGLMRQAIALAVDVGDPS